MIDESIIRLLDQRVKYVKQIGNIKKELHLPAYDPSRWKQVLNSRIKIGLQYGLNQLFIRKIYNVIHKYSLSIEK